ncbi:MAG: hypothetical protein AAGE98_12830, partial [Actinomycetota bacterium]
QDHPARTRGVSPAGIRVECVGDAPIITPASHPSIGTNIQGPSVIRVPHWLPNPLGRYYCYFADHKGSFIRLAFADEVEGPWTVHVPGSLHLADSGFPTQDLPLDDATFDRIAARYREALGDQMPADIRDDLVAAHIASPDVHVDDERREIVMYLHGLETLGDQRTRVALSGDGVTFRALPDTQGPSYFRCFSLDGWWYALAMPGRFFRSRDGRTDFEEGPRLFDASMRHSAVRVVDGPSGRELEVFWTRVGDAPERIVRTRVAIEGDWTGWHELGEPVDVLRPERSYEGADEPCEPSRRGAVNHAVNQVRDPCLFRDPDRGGWWLFYAVAGESGIALARL